MTHDLVALPKAHLHLHLTGAMRHSTLVELARTHGVSLPPALTQDWPPQLSTVDERGWFRFQRLYDIARSVLRTTDDLYRLVREIAEDERRRRVAVAGACRPTLRVTPAGMAGLPPLLSCCWMRLLSLRRRLGLGSPSLSRPTGLGIRWMRGCSPGLPRSSRGGAWLGSGCLMMSGAGPRRSLSGRSGLPAGLDCCSCRIAGSCSGRPALRRRWTGCGRPDRARRACR